MNLEEIRKNFIDLIISNDLKLYRYSQRKNKTSKNHVLKWQYQNYFCKKYFMVFFNIKVVGVNFPKNHGMKGADVAKEVLNDLESFFPKPDVFKHFNLNWEFLGRYHFWKNYLYQFGNLGEIDNFYGEFFNIHRDIHNTIHKNAIKVTGKEILGRFLDIGYLPRNLADLLHEKLFFPAMWSIVGIIPNNIKRNFNIDLLIHWDDSSGNIWPLKNDKKKIPAKKAEFLNLKQIRRKIRIN
jgi:hypothetical protein